MIRDHNAVRTYRHHDLKDWAGRFFGRAVFVVVGVLVLVADLVAPVCIIVLGVFVYLAHEER